MILANLPRSARILEIGGGTGAQARALAERGYRVASIDLATSNYADDRVFPVEFYDGMTIPFDAGEFEVVFSSNVLEHVASLGILEREIRRVLRPGGICVHVLPSGCWRFWSSLTHCFDHLMRAAAELVRSFPRSPRPQELLRCIVGLSRTLGLLGRAFVPNRHGETGNAITEIWLFSRRRWLSVFRSQGYRVVAARPMGLFYTGYMLLGDRLSLNVRARLARVLGSACVLYVLDPSP